MKQEPNDITILEAIMGNDRLEELHKLYFYLIPLFHKSRTYYSAKIPKDCTINKNQVMAIMVIGKSKMITSTALSKFISMEKGSLTTLIDSLVEKGLVVRSGDPNDRRKVLLSLTAEGNTHMQKLEDRSKHALALMIENLTEAEQDEMTKSIRSLVVLFKKISDSTN